MGTANRQSRRGAQKLIYYIVIDCYHIILVIGQPVLYVHPFSHAVETTEELRSSASRPVDGPAMLLALCLRIWLVSIRIVILIKVVSGICKR